MQSNFDMTNAQATDLATFNDNAGFMHHTACQRNQAKSHKAITYLKISKEPALYSGQQQTFN
jgi:hypothetical protein